jgi:SAM-dependent methyltransferase
MASAYSLPLIYDIAFGDRNVEGEIDFLLNAAEINFGQPIGSAVELACGPGQHFRATARTGIVSDGVDLSPEMVEYANELIARDKLSAAAHQGDMRNWRAPRKYDLAYCLLVSFAHLLSNDDILAHFNCVADLLSPRGIYIISHAHPRDFYGSVEPSIERIWVAERDGITVETDWGGEHQTFDPITEVDELTISYTVTSDGNSERFESRERLRRLSYQTFLALIRQSGRFELAATYGDFDLGCRLDSPNAVRLLAVLRKI